MNSTPIYNKKILSTKEDISKIQTTIIIWLVTSIFMAFGLFTYIILKFIK